MTRTVTKTSLGPGLETVTIRYRSEDCASGTQESRVEQIALLRTIGDTPMLHNCGAVPFAKLYMHHDGSAWIVEISSVAQKMVTRDF